MIRFCSLLGRVLVSAGLGLWLVTAVSAATPTSSTSNSKLSSTAGGTISTSQGTDDSTSETAPLPTTPSSPAVAPSALSNLTGAAEPLETAAPVPLSSTTAIRTLKAGDTLYLNIVPPASTLSSPIPLPASRIFTLDKAGALSIPYLGSFQLAGLTEEEAVLRLKAERLLEDYTVELRVLPVEKVGVEALKPFGYSLFDLPSTTFAPTQDIPVPVDYVIGANDTVIIQLFGAVNETYTLVVSRDGTIDVPKVGPIAVAGLTFQEMKANIARRAATQMIGVSSHVTLGTLRSILVFVMGDVVKPGSYTVSSLSTLTNALFTSGGVTTVGSLREIQLKRRGVTVTRLDFYDLLLKGDTSRDVRLQGGDVIFVPPVGRTVGIAGEVRRPAIYELREEKTIKELLTLAGGMTPSAYSRGVQLQRISATQDRVQKDIDLSVNSAMQTKLSDGDVLFVPGLLDQFEDLVRVSGYVKRPGTRAWFDGMKLTDMIPSMRSMFSKPDLDYALIKRHIPGERQVKVFSVRLGEALAQPESSANVVLVRGDEIIVFGHEVEGDRQNKLASILAELERQGTQALPAKLVNINGAVYEPGVYPLEAGMRVSDLIRASGSLKEQAETLTAELSRYENTPGKGRYINHKTVDLSKALQGDPAADLELTPRDYLVIKAMPEWGSQQTITLSGEVQNPGVYPIAHGESLSSVIKRAGGLTAMAFADGAIFSRVELQQKEEAQFKELADRIEAELKTTILERVDEIQRPQENADVAKSLVDLLRNAKSAGRMVIDLPAILDKDSDQNSDGEYDVTLLGGDAILIPQRKDEVSVMGEVRKPATHLYAKGQNVDDYLDQSGGINEKSKRNLVYIIRANGSATLAKSRSIFSFKSRMDIRPGDTIVAMLDVEKVSKLKVWRDVVGSMAGIGSIMSGSANLYTAIHGQKIYSNATQIIVP